MTNKSAQSNYHFDTMKPNSRVPGHRLRRIREYLGWSRPDMGEALGIPPTTLKNYELGYRELGSTVIFNMAQHMELSQYVPYLISNATVSELYVANLVTDANHVDAKKVG